jgi:hypothetical protein
VAEQKEQRLVKLYGLYQNVSKSTGKTYFVGNLTLFTKMLIFKNEDAKEGEPG